MPIHNNPENIVLLLFRNVMKSEHLTERCYGIRESQFTNITSLTYKLQILNGNSNTLWCDAKVNYFFKKFMNKIMNNDSGYCRKDIISLFEIAYKIIKSSYVKSVLHLNNYFKVKLHIIPNNIVLCWVFSLGNFCFKHCRNYIDCTMKIETIHDCFELKISIIICIKNHVLSLLFNLSHLFFIIDLNDISVYIFKNLCKWFDILYKSFFCSFLKMIFLRLTFCKFQPT